MKKILALVLAAMMCMTALVSCGENGPLYDYNYDEYLTLGTYKGVELKTEKIQEEYDKQIDTILTNNAKDEETKKPAVDTNRITFGLSATVGGVEASALAKKSVTIVLGTGTTGYKEIDTALVGMSTGETKEVTLVVPAGKTGKAEIDGKEAVFKISVTAVTENVKPQTLTDEMVKKATSEEYKTVAEYTEYLRTAIRQNLAWEAAVSKTTFIKYPKREAEMYYDNYLSSYQATASQYGMTLESLASIYGMTLDSLQNSLAKQAVDQANQDMALLAIAQKESIVPDEAKIAEVKAEMMKYYGYKTEAELLAVADEDSIRRSATYDLVLEFIEKNAVEVK